MTLFDSMVVCLFVSVDGWGSVNPINPDYLAMLNAATGWNLDEAEFYKIGERIANLARPLAEFVLGRRAALATATDGRKALELARQGTPDLIVLDVMLPGLDGLEVAKALKADARTKSVPIVMLTGAAQPQPADAGRGGLQRRSARRSGRSPAPTARRAPAR